MKLNLEALIISVATVVVGLFVWESFLKDKLVKTQATAEEYPV